MRGPYIEAASPCKHAGKAKLADGATVLVILPPSVSPGHVFTTLTVPYRHRTIWRVIILSKNFLQTAWIHKNQL